MNIRIAINSFALDTKADEIAALVREFVKTQK
jgi:hypothetical protein